ncbi:MAG: radical SAM protein [Bdellovibrionaceae bacterium]|nr:hypothetical protein [Bdellovibrionales bacterium]MCB9085839.1 radical SAM protein [Pseudobdellovibrionaceae bacterium]
MEQIGWSPRLETQFDKVFIHRDSWNSPVARRARKIFAADKVEQVDHTPLSEPGDHLSADEFNRSKRLLYLTEYKGRFFKRCPGARPGLACCNYFVLNLGLQCDMNCTYCYLQSFLNTPLLTIYTNMEQALREMAEFLDEQPDMNLRIGTGETVDSLSLDDLTLYSRELIAFFRRAPHWRLELKTKSSKVDQFLDMDHAGNVIVSWSLNPQHVIDQEEFDTASLQKRLQAARKCRDKGYLLTFHLDPLIFHPGWQENYKGLVEEITKWFTPNEVLTISLGALRFQPEQRHIMRERFGLKSYVTQAEMFRSHDGKFRYDLDMRRTMFDFVLNEFRRQGEGWNLFLCMETRESWMGAMTGMPKSVPGLDEYFDHRALRAFRQHRQQSDLLEGRTTR